MVQHYAENYYTVPVGTWESGLVRRNEITNSDGVLLDWEYVTVAHTDGEYLVIESGYEDHKDSETVAEFAEEFGLTICK